MIRTFVTPQITRLTNIISMYYIHLTLHQVKPGLIIYLYIIVLTWNPPLLILLLLPFPNLSSTSVIESAPMKNQSISQFGVDRCMWYAGRNTPEVFQEFFPRSGIESRQMARLKQRRLNLIKTVAGEDGGRPQ